MFQQLFDKLRSNGSNGQRSSDTSRSSSFTTDSAVSSGCSVPVYLNIYDMYWINEYTTNIGLGVYHSGVEVHGEEYCYGGHPLEATGIFNMVPKDCEELGENYQFKMSLEVGRTDFTDEDVRTIIESLGQDFRGDQYHLFNKNCNHFSDSLLHILCGKSIPKWVNRLATLSARIPFIERAIPKEWITPLAFEESLEQEEESNAARATPVQINAPIPNTANSASRSRRESTSGTTGSGVEPPSFLHHWQVHPPPSTSQPSSPTSPTAPKNGFTEPRPTNREATNRSTTNNPRQS